jgi:hypothetical protein
VIDAYLQKRKFAAKISGHTLNVQRSRPQLISELPLDYVRSRQRLAVPIYEAGDATEQYLASQILVGFTSFWKKASFIKFPVRTEKVYFLIKELLDDVRLLYDLHLQKGGATTEPFMSNTQGNAINRHTSAHTGGTQSFQGQRDSFLTCLRSQSI